ncbi:conserved hypothetical protein [Ricinus communis]|uniref:Uncharacterized protein n=1 Tax=Ricinus communis TaxID=3988 RepID=B9RY05_RICCO|nr:conserved hypothetical protein [Ricinus communis]
MKVVLNAPSMIHVIWARPPFGWIKINTDDMTRGALGPLGATGVCVIPLKHNYQ